MSLLEELQTKVQSHSKEKCEISTGMSGIPLEKKPLNKKEDNSLITNVSGATLLGALVAGVAGAVVAGIAGYYLLRK